MTSFNWRYFPKIAFLFCDSFLSVNRGQKVNNKRYKQHRRQREHSRARAKKKIGFWQTGNACLLQLGLLWFHLAAHFFFYRPINLCGKCVRVCARLTNLNRDRQRSLPFFQKLRAFSILNGDSVFSGTVQKSTAL